MGIVNHDIEMVREKYPAFEISKRESDYIFSGELILNHVFEMCIRDRDCNKNSVLSSTLSLLTKELDCYCNDLSHHFSEFLHSF